MISSLTSPKLSTCRASRKIRMDQTILFQSLQFLSLIRAKLLYRAGIILNSLIQKGLNLRHRRCRRPQVKSFLRTYWIILTQTKILQSAKAKFHNSLRKASRPWKENQSNFLTKVIPRPQNQRIAMTKSPTRSRLS